MVLPEAVQRLLAAGRSRTGFLGPHHGEAARRLAGIFERARLMQRVTMAYDAARIGGRGSMAGQADLADSAAAARARLNRLAAALPKDCWSVLFDCCGLDKGLQQIEQERGWPRRSAKLVLRIGLDHLTKRWGLAETADGQGRQGLSGWLPERVPMFKDDAGRDGP